MTSFKVPVLAVVLSVSLSIFGCAKKESIEIENKTASTNDHETHAHPSEGPHHGPLIELGNEDYHAELIHDEKSETVTIYILDSGAKNAVPIDSQEIVVNLKHDGKGEQFSLTAEPLEGEPEGESSRFVSTGKELNSLLDEESAEATLVITAMGKSYRGKIPHAHDHGHDH